MNSHNSFSPETHDIIRNIKKCYNCQSNRADCLHHIVGRGNGDSKCESSILNASFLCNFKCHLPKHGYWRTKEGVKKLLNKTLNYLFNIKYTFKPIDYEFLDKYKDYY
jgi:hypothetical protein